jgi:hypothetical protein
MVAIAVYLVEQVQCGEEKRIVSPSRRRHIIECAVFVQVALFGGPKPKPGYVSGWPSLAALGSGPLAISLVLSLAIAFPIPPG